ADPDLAAVAKNPVPYARLRAALWTYQLNVRRVQRRLPLDDAALDVPARIRPRMALDHVDTFNDQPVSIRKNFQNAAALAAVFAGDDQHVIVPANRRSET